jgi:hypothetical protein
MLENAIATKTYLYAIINAAEARSTYGRIGIGESEVYTLVDGALAAVVSDVPNERLRPERRHLAAHHAVHKGLLAAGPFLPMSFGIIADSPVAIRRIMTLNADAFVRQLQRVAGKVEMTLKVQWDVPSIFEYFVRTHPELRMLRDRLFAGGHEPAEDDKIDLGRLFDRMLNEDRAADAQRVIEVLGPLCTEICENPQRTERHVMDLACLVPAEGQQRFQQGVFDAAKQFDDNYSFDYSGPWPPYNFVDVALTT